MKRSLFDGCAFIFSGSAFCFINIAGSIRDLFSHVRSPNAHTEDAREGRLEIYSRLNTSLAADPIFCLVDLTS